jgi:hypothetical protein
VKWERNLIFSTHSTSPCTLSRLGKLPFQRSSQRKDISTILYHQYMVSYCIKKYSNTSFISKDCLPVSPYFIFNVKTRLKILNNIKMLIKLEKRKHLFLTWLRDEFIQTWFLRESLWKNERYARNLIWNATETQIVNSSTYGVLHIIQSVECIKRLWNLYLCSMLIVISLCNLNLRIMLFFECCFTLVPIKEPDECVKSDQNNSIS